VVTGAQGEYCSGGLRRGKSVTIKVNKVGYSPSPMTVTKDISAAQNKFDAVLLRRSRNNYYTGACLAMVKARLALFRADAELSGLESRDSLFLKPALLVSDVNERFQSTSMAASLKKLGDAKNYTQKLTKKRPDRISDRSGDVSPQDVQRVIGSVDSALDEVEAVYLINQVKINPIKGLLLVGPCH
jgi:hypothetical protein